MLWCSTGGIGFDMVKVGGTTALPARLAVCRLSLVPRMSGRDDMFLACGVYGSSACRLQLADCLKV